MSDQTPQIDTTEMAGNQLEDIDRAIDFWRRKAEIATRALEWIIKHATATHQAEWKARNALERMRKVKP